MPDADARLLDVRTSPVAERIAAVDDFVAAGYEVHLNLSPVVLRDGWEADWTALLEQLDDELGDAAKAQAAAEVIMLTHNERLHEVNLGWHPQAEDAAVAAGPAAGARSARTACSTSATATTSSGPASPGCGS